MSKHQDVLISIFGFLMATVVGDNYCVYKECFCQEADIACSNLGLTKFPEIVPEFQTYYEELNLDQNNITIIPGGGLTSNLKQFSMVNNPLTAINDTAFDAAAFTLESLKFSKVIFTKLPDAFIHLKSITSLSLTDSRISDWNVDAMKSMGQTLQILNVESCNFTVWPDWIKYLSHLTQLTMSNNYISSIPDDALDNVKNSLTSLTLDGNNLTSVPRAFSKLSALENLYLQQNRISDVNSLPPGSKLLSLTLSTNNIFDADQLSKALEPYAGSLNDFSIDNNHLSAIPSLPNMTELYSFDFSNNRISDPLSGSMPPEVNRLFFGNNVLPFIPRVYHSLNAIVEMDATWNAIQVLRDTDFPLWIIDVELSSNLITELTDTSFPANCSIEYLQLDNNPISRISMNAFKNVPSLYQLGLERTKLTRLPLALTDLDSLSYVDFTGSTNLVCTCLEKSLQHRIMSMMPDNVGGDCGLSSVYNFFENLIQACP